MACIVCKKTVGASFGELFYKPSDSTEIIKGHVYECCYYRLASCDYCTKRQNELVKCIKDTMLCNKFSQERCCKEHVNTSPVERIKATYNTPPEKYTGFIGKPKDNLYMGIELEVETVKTTIVKGINQVWDRLGNFIITKHDGSLTKGFEIASAPAPFDFHKTAWLPLLNDRPKQLHSYSYPEGHATANTINCGMHVHISKKGFTTPDVGKSAYFINKPTNEKLITDIAGRYNTYYCGIQPVPIEKIPDYYMFDKHVCVRTSKDATIEFRMFKGTLNKLMFLKNIEFSHALVKFVKDKEVVDLNTKQFCKYVEERQGNYDNLYKYLVFKQYLKGEKLPETEFINV